MTRLLASAALCGFAFCAVLGLTTQRALAEDAPKSPDKTTGDAPKPDKAVETPAKVMSEAEVTALIDAEIAKAWAAAEVTPAKATTDEEFVRRVYLDVVGLPPTPEEADKFLKDDGKDKRATLISALLADERFGRHLADLWTPVLLGRATKKVKSPVDDLFAVWLATQFNKNRGFNLVAYDIITASGDLADNPAVAYFATRKDQKTADFAGLASKHFTGVQIQCAQCHHHPYEKWTQDDFAGVASFFQPMQLQKGKSEPQNPKVIDVPVRRATPRGPKKAADPVFLSPKYLGGDEVAIEDARLWRSAYAKWVIGADNPQTPRYMANRFWSFVFGEAFVMPVDDFNSTNEAHLPGLLDALGKDMRAGGFDIKRYYRAMLNTKAYQLESNGASRKDGKPLDLWLFAQYPVRQLAPEQLFGELVTVASDGQLEKQFRREAGNPFTMLRIRHDMKPEGRKKGDKDKNDAKEGKKGDKKDPDAKPDAMEDDTNKKKEKDFDEETNAKFEALIESMSDNWYLRRVLSANYSSQSSDDEMTDADGFSLTIDQALMVMNGLATSQMTAFYKGSTLQQVLAAGQLTDERLNAIFTRVLTRKPSEKELKHFTTFINAETKAKRPVEEVYADVLMALMMTTEFATNH